MRASRKGTHLNRRLRQRCARAGGGCTKIVFYVSSLVSSYWNGAATYYRGIIRDLARRSYDVTCSVPDAYERQSRRDIEPPDWCRVVVYPATIEAMKDVVG